MKFNFGDILQMKNYFKLVFFVLIPMYLDYTLKRLFVWNRRQDPTSLSTH